MCKLKGETPQEGINRRQSGDRARHGGQMAERQPLWVQSVFCCHGVGSRMGRPWIPDYGEPEGTTWLITEMTCGGTSGSEVGGSV